MTKVYSIFFQYLCIPSVWAGVLFLAGCQTLKLSHSSVDADACDRYGVVRAFEGFDGCRLLIVTDEGRKLLPASIEPVTFELAAGQRVAFSYVTAEDVESPCLAEDQIVAITCIRVVEADAGIPNREPCREWETLDGWLSERVAERQARTVTRYPYRDDRWAYWLRGGPTNYLYDCQGSLICDSSRETDCLQLVGDREDGTVIWRAQ